MRQFKNIWIFALAGMAWFISQFNRGGCIMEYNKIIFPPIYIITAVMLVTLLEIFFEAQNVYVKILIAFLVYIIIVKTFTLACGEWRRRKHLRELAAGKKTKGES